MGSKVILSEKEIPTEWYNIIPDLPLSLPPATGPRTGYLEVNIEATLDKLPDAPAPEQQQKWKTKA